MLLFFPWKCAREYYVYIMPLLDLLPDHHFQILQFHPQAKDEVLSMVNKVMLQLNQLHPIQQLIQKLLYLFYLESFLH